MGFNRQLAEVIEDQELMIFEYCPEVENNQ